MEISPDQLLIEAGQMALHLRFMEREVVQLRAENQELKSRLAEKTPEEGA